MMHHNTLKDIPKLTTSIQQKAIEQLAITKAVYELSPSRMIAEYKGERENVKNYNGRQILEMLQNADDAAAGCQIRMKKKAVIVIDEQTLIFGNTGEPFSPEGLNSIFHSHLSPKAAKEEQIGKKGLGFRSILSWATQVSIKSHELMVSFSRKNSEVVFAELIKKDSFAVKLAELNPTDQFPIATLVCPNVEPIGIIDFDGCEDYDTLIQLDLKPNIRQKVENQIKDDLDAQILLFLNHLEQIDIVVDGVRSHYTKDILSDNQILLSWESPTETGSRIYNVHRITGTFEDIDKDYTLAMAWDDELQDGKDQIYSFFRTAVSFPSPGLLHGSFELNADRNAIIQDEEEYNKKLVSLIPTLVAQVGELVATKNSESVNFRGLSFLNLNFQELSKFQEPGKMSKDLWDAMKTKKVFPLTSGNYCSWNSDHAPCYYLDPIFSAMLDPKIFSEIIPKCKDDNIEKWILKEIPQQYTIKGIFVFFSQHTANYSFSDYAKIIISIHNLIDRQDQVLGNSLFYDMNMEPLTFDNHIFLPSKKEFDLPVSLNVQIIHHQLAEALLRELDVENYESISAKLPLYNLREYQAEEVIGKLIAYFSVKPTSKDTVDLHHYLFQIFLLGGVDRSRKWMGSSPPMLTATGTVAIANTLYLGKEYGNELTGKLYHFNRSILLASAKRYAIKPEQLDDWVEYLGWFQVANAPRAIIVSPDRDYCDYCMRNLDYKVKIHEYQFKNYRDFKSKNTSLGEARVESIDRLEEVLIHNPPEAVLEFLYTYKMAYEVLDKDKEISSSYLTIKIDRKHRDIKGARMASYIRWKVSQVSWLETQSGTKAAPANCSTAAYIDHHFDGLVDRPKVNFDLLAKKGIPRKKVENLLENCGVHRSIGTFSQQLIYTILLKLPALEVEAEKKAKTILNQLSANYDERDVDNFDAEDNLYQEFRQTGQVLTKEGSFESISNVYYVNDRRYGESVLRHFKTIDIERRRGMDKIRKMFGVRPINDLNIEIKAEPNDHPLSYTFEQEIKSFKPFVYALRKEYDAQGTELERIKDTGFRIVSSLQVEMNQNGDLIEFDLKAFEYFYQKTRNLVYIVLPEPIFTTIAELKEDIRFCSVIGEIFSSILDLDTQRQQIRELFSKDNAVREELLRSEMEDVNLEKLNNSRKALGVVTNPKLAFWSAFVTCYPKKRIKLDWNSDASLRLSLVNALPTLVAEIDCCLEQLHYSDINIRESAEAAVDLFKAANISLLAFNQAFYPPIDIIEIYRLRWKELLHANKLAFENLYYHRCVSVPELQKGFEEAKYQYINQEIDVSTTDIGVDLVNILFEQVSKSFHIDLALGYAKVDILQIEQNNTSQVLAALDGQKISLELLREFFNHHQEARALRAFNGNIDTIVELFKHWKGSSPTIAASGNSGSKRMTINGKPVIYSDLYDLRSQMDAILKGRRNNLPLTNIITVNIGLLDKTRGGKPSGVRPSPKAKIPKEELGFLGEYLVYLHLIATVNDKESIQWVSRYARDCGVATTGVDGDGYDIAYRPNNSKHTRYVEVKVSSTGDAFHMTANEVKEAERLKGNYEIFLVRNIESLDKVGIDRIVGMFDYKGSSFNKNTNFSVENETFLIKFKPKAKQ